MTTHEFTWEKTKQFSLFQTFIAFVIPGVIAFIGFRMVLPMLVDQGLPAIVAWSVVASVMLGILVTAAMMFHHKEAKKLQVSLSSRMCLKKLSVKQWLVSFGILLLGLLIAGGAVQLVKPFMLATGLTIPEYMPFFLNPTINPAEADPSMLSPGFPLQGQFFLIPLLAVTLLLNILAEEFYFRAWILPKLSHYGHLGWILNAVFFALYHAFQFWLFPTILVGSLLWAFVIYHTKSIWPAFAGHLVGNFLFGILGIVLLILQ